MAAETKPKKFIPAFDLPELSARHVLANWKLFAFVNIPLIFAILLNFVANDKANQAGINGSSSVNNGEMAAIFGIGIGFLALFLLVYIIFYAMSVRLSLNVLTGKSTTTDDLVETARKYSLRMIGLALVSMVIVIAGLILLIIPGIVLAIMLSLAPYIMIDKDKGITDSLTESFNMVKDNAKPFLAAFGVFILLSIGLGIIGGFHSVTYAVATLASVLFILMPAIRYLEMRRVKIAEPAKRS